MGMTCRICGNEADNVPYEVREMLSGLAESFRYFQCAGCRCLQIAEIPADLSRYYPATYHAYGTELRSGKIKNFLSKCRNRYAVWNAGLLGRFLYAEAPSTPLYALRRIGIALETRILDVGCGAGALLLALHGIGMKNLMGIDPYNPEDLEIEPGLVIQRKSLREVEGLWDVVMFHHSFEHMPDPADTLQTVARRLVPGGWCMIRTPTVSSYAWKHYGTDWVQLDAPRHLFVHSIESMKRLAEQSGLELVETVYDSNAFQFWGSEQVRKGIPLESDRSYAVDPKASMFTKRELARFRKRARELNAAGQGDQAVFYLRRKNG